MNTTTLQDALKALVQGSATITAVSDSQMIEIRGTDGSLAGKVSKANLAKAIMGANPAVDNALFSGRYGKAAYSNVLVAVRSHNDDYPRAYYPENLPSTGVDTEGVLIVGGDKMMLIAKDENQLAWGPTGITVIPSDSPLYVGTNRKRVLKMDAGRACTKAIVANPEYASAEYAAAWCNQYTCVTDSYDTSKTSYSVRKAGEWYLPSIPELMMMYANFGKINDVMEFIGGTKLTANWYWSSSGRNANTSWGLNLSSGNLHNYSKSSVGRVRPVAAF